MRHGRRPGSAGRGSDRGAVVGALTVVGLLVALVLAARAGWVQAAAASWADLLGGTSAGSTTRAASGEQVTVPGSGPVPDLEVRVLDVVPVSPRTGPPPRGERLWAAYVVVRNRGDRPHRPPASFAPDLLDASGDSHAATDLAVRRGRSLPTDVALRPGATVQGYAAWSLPRGVRPKAVVLRGAGATVRWAVGPTS